jgi:hypothetical protein
MKECPECGKSCRDYRLTCDCGYEFPVFVGDIAGTVSERRPDLESFSTGKRLEIVLRISFCLLLVWSILGFLINQSLPNPTCYEGEDMCVRERNLFVFFCGVPTVIAWLAWFTVWNDFKAS